MSKPTKPIPPVDLREVAYWFGRDENGNAEFQTDPRYIAHLEAQQAKEPA